MAGKVCTLQLSWVPLSVFRSVLWPACSALSKETRLLTGRSWTRWSLKIPSNWNSLFYSILFYSVLSRFKFNLRKRTALRRYDLSLFPFPSPRLQIWGSLANKILLQAAHSAFPSLFAVSKEALYSSTGLRAWIAHDIGQQEFWCLLHRNKQWIAFLAMHFSDTSKASSMCGDISPAVLNPIPCKGDIHCVSVPLEPDLWGSQTKHVAQPEGRGKMQELEGRIIGQILYWWGLWQASGKSQHHQKGEGCSQPWCQSFVLRGASWVIPGLGGI